MRERVKSKPVGRRRFVGRAKGCVITTGLQIWTADILEKQAGRGRSQVSGYQYDLVLWEIMEIVAS